MNNRLGSRAVGMSLVLAVFAVSACGDDDDDAPGGSSAAAGVSGSSAGSSKGGSSAGSNSPNGGKAGSSQAGTGGDAEGGLAGEASGGSSVGGGMTGEGGNAGGTDLGGAGAGGDGVGGDGGSGTNADCDYTAPESDGFLDTGITASSTVQTVCAVVNNGAFDDAEGIVDGDDFEFGVPLGSDVLVRVEMLGSASLDAVEVYVNGRFTLLADGRAAVRKETLDSDIMEVRLYALNDADIAASLPYKVSLVVDDVDARCAASTAAATFTEASDGVDSRGNDVYQVSDSVAAFTAAADTAEASGITVAAPPASYRIIGTSADIDGLGWYYDGDSYAFHTGANASQITLRADWDGTDRDVDLYLFKAGEDLETAVGFEASFTGDYLTAAVEPDTDYVIWSGLYEGTAPFEYSLTLCSEAFSIDGE